MKPALSDPGFVRRIRASASGRRIFLTDFDGTLAPIVPNFLKARADARMIRALQRLRSAGWTVILLTGRGLKDLRSRIPIGRMVCGGNHGWEWTGSMRSAPGLPSEAVKRRVRAEVRIASRVLRAHLGEVPGVRVESKLFFAAVHHRLVPAARAGDFDRAFARARKDPSLRGFRWRKGKKIWELLSPVRWGKGEAAKLLIRRYRPDLVVAAGDDATDEEMFAAVDRRAGLSVRVGRLRSSQAGYFVPNQAQMVRLIHLLTQTTSESFKSSAARRAGI